MNRQIGQRAIVSLFRVDRANRNSAITLTALIAIFASVWVAPRPALAQNSVTSGNTGVITYGSNTGYLKQPSTSGSPVTVTQNGTVLVGAGLFYPHSTIITNNSSNPVTDTQFYNMVSNALFAGGQWTQDSLDIHMAQCFSGGFIDELDDNNVNNVSINTAAWWGTTSYGTVNGPTATNRYSGAWYNALTSAPAAPGPYTVGQLSAYQTGVANDIRANLEKPQYFSNGPVTGGAKGGNVVNAMDNDVIGRAASTKNFGNEYALVFVGSDSDGGGTTGNRHWNDAIKYINYLITQGYKPGNIDFDYVNGTKPAGGVGNVPAGVQMATGSAGNMSIFFNNEVKNNAANGQVTVWVADHGGLKNTFSGKVALALKPNGTGKISVNLPIGAAALQSYVTNAMGDASVEIDPGNITGLVAGDQLDAILSDPQGDSFDLGDVSMMNAANGDNLDAPYADMATIETDEMAAGDKNGDLTLQLANYDSTNPNSPFSGDYSAVDVDGFSINFGAFQTLDVPEPASLALCFGLATLIAARRRRTTRA